MEDNVDEQYIKLLKELLNQIENAISQANYTSEALDTAEGEAYSMQYQLEETLGQIGSAKNENEQVISELEELHADVESEIIKEENNAINAR